MRRGLSLGEVVVALGILAVAGLAVMGVFSQLMAAQSKSGHQVVARTLAQDILEKADVAGPPLWGMTGPTLEGSRALSLQGAAEPVQFRYRLTASTVRDAPATNPMGTLYNLKVEVWWQGEGPDNIQIGSGRTSVSIDRMVYVER